MLIRLLCGDISVPCSSQQQTENHRFGQQSSIVSPYWYSMKQVAAIFFVSFFIGYYIIDDFDSSLLRGKNVIVTGASGGIGEQIAYHYARMGANLLITARSESRLKQVIKQCEELGDSTRRYLYHVADMSDVSATESLIQKAKEGLGNIDYLVLNHIVLTYMGLWLGSKENFTGLSKTVDVNFLSYAHLASHAIEPLQKTNGSIIVVSSLAGKTAQPYTIGYSASKFALDGFFSGLRQELSMRGIDVSITLCIIGLVDTSNAIKKIQEMNASNILKWIPMARAEDTALAIIKGGAVRAREVFYPYLPVRISSMINNLAPGLLEKFMQLVYQIN